MKTRTFLAIATSVIAFVLSLATVVVSVGGAVYCAAGILDAVCLLLQDVGLAVVKPFNVEWSYIHFFAIYGLSCLLERGRDFMHAKSLRFERPVSRIYEGSVTKVL